MGQTIKMLAFSDDGITLGKRIIEKMKNDEPNIELDLHRCGVGELSEWTAQGFREADALIFIGAVGIAVRAIAPFVEKKTIDPAVLCIDDGGRFVIPLLSGHLGGANALASRVAEGIDAIPVITTATDDRKTFAVDTFAKEMGLGIVNPEKIKAISSAVLRGESVTVCAGEEELHLVGKRYCLGVGMKRNMEAQKVLDACDEFLQCHQIQSAEIFGIATIDLKKDESAIFALKKQLDVPVKFYSAEELMEVEGEFSSSYFVRDVTGADNVCERAAMRMAEVEVDRRFAKERQTQRTENPGEDDNRQSPQLVVKKETMNGITFALAKMTTVRNWKWV